VPGPAAVVDRDGWIAAVSAAIGTDRVAVPSRRAVHGARHRQLPPGAGARRLAAASRGGPAVPTQLRLDLHSRPPHAVVEGSTVWRYPLTLRHAELLALLMEAGAAGLDAFALSAAVYGDDHHAVAVRAEVSRLRRRLGGILLARPYRIAPNITVQPCDPAAVRALRPRRRSEP
jgi:hypothetical protein